MVKYSLLFLLIISFQGKAQYCHPSPPEVLNGVYKEFPNNRKTIPYSPLREADVMWNKRIWRVINLKEKINHPLYFPVNPITRRTSFMQMIMHYVSCESEELKIQAFDVMDDEFTLQLTRKEVIEKSFVKEEVSYEDENGNFKTDIVDNPFDFSSIKRLRIKEEWFFDNQRSTMNVRIIGVSPIQEVFDEMGEYKGEKPLLWLYFPELRIPMTTTMVFNPKNLAGKISFDQVFMKRMFSSYIFKESNVYDRKISTYKQNLDLLLESKKIEHEIFQLEQDLWEY